MPHEIAAIHENHPGKLKNLNALYPTGRIGTPQDIAELVLYLIEDAPAFMPRPMRRAAADTRSALHAPQSLYFRRGRAPRGDC